MTRDNRYSGDVGDQPISVQIESIAADRRHSEVAENGPDRPRGRRFKSCPRYKSETAGQRPGSWITTGPVLAFGVSTASADIASRGARRGVIAKCGEAWRRSADGRSPRPLCRRPRGQRAQPWPCVASIPEGNGSIPGLLRAPARSAIASSEHWRIGSGRPQTGQTLPADGWQPQWLRWSGE